MGVIYKHTINGDSYIGYTKYTMEYRLNQHIMAAERGIKSHFYNKLRKYGYESIQSDILEECDDDLMQDREKFWIDHFDTFNNGMNMTIGGDGGPIRKGMKNSDEWKIKASQAQKGKSKKNKGMCGKYEKTEQHKNKLSEANKGKVWVSNVDLEIEKQIDFECLDTYINNGFVKGRKVTDFSKVDYNVVISDEQKKKLSEAIKGRIHIHNPITKEAKMIFCNEYINYESNGFIKGRLKK